MDNEDSTPEIRPIKVNSIKDSSAKRILKPCEARAGHGMIIILFAYSVILGIMYSMYRGVAWLIEWLKP